MASPTAGGRGRAASTARPLGDWWRRLLLGFAGSAVLPLLLVVYLALPYLVPGVVGGPTVSALAGVFLLAVIVVLAVLQVVTLRVLLEVAGRSPAERAAEATAPLSPPAPAAPQGTPVEELGEEVRALLDSAKSDEVAALLREFTRILNAFQRQASQVQEYAARFEAMNEELRTANLRLREMSLTDELTEVGNRRNFDMRMREEINRSSRFGHAFSLLLLDIDGFKKFNDEFGHPQGDVVLRGLGALMRSMSREGDVPCRVGGEEFAFILPETGKGDAMTFAERIRRGVEANIMAPDGARPLTVSIGLAAFPDDGKSPEEILNASDEALYQSKRDGRNRVTAYRRRD